MDTAKIYIYGIIDSNQDANAAEWGYVNLKGVKDQLDAQPNTKEIEVHIHSEGGVVTEGFAIHDFLRSQGKPVTTIIDGVCASIATVVLLAGDVRVGTENAKPFIHNPWGMAGGDKEELRKYADELETMENDIAEFYAAKTKLTTAEALDYMRNETAFTATEALANGMLTKIETVMRAVALLKPNNIKTMAKENLTKEEAQSMFDGVLNSIKAILKPSKNSEPQNKTVADANGVELLFADVEDDAQEAVGDKATVDGSAAEGDVLMPNGETYVFEAGELKEIKPAESTDDDADVEALQAEVDDLKTQLADAQALAQANADEAADEKAKAKALKASLKDIKAQVKQIKENVGSNFNWEPKKKNFKKDEANEGRFSFKKADK